MRIDSLTNGSLTKVELLSGVALVEEKFNSLVNHSELVELYLLPDFSVGFVSPSIEQITGYAADDFLQHSEPFKRLFHPDDLADYNAIKEDLAEKGIPDVIEKRLITKDGEVRWMLLRFAKVEDKNGKVNGFICSATDITSRKTAELELSRTSNRLREVESKYRIVADNTYDMERWILPDKTLAYISPSCKRITGYSREEFMENMGLHHEIIHPEDRERYASQFEKVFEMGIMGQGEFRLITKNGETRWVGVVAQKVKDKDGNDMGLRVSSRDITESVYFRNQLAISEARYKAVVESQSELIIRHSSDSTILFVNNAFARFNGRKAMDLIGLKWLDLLTKDVAADLRRMMDSLSEENPSAEYEMKNKRYDGIEHWFSWISTGIFDQKGFLQEFQVVGRDITQKKEAELKLAEAMARIQELKGKLERENTYLRDKFLPTKNNEGLVYNSPLMHEVLEKVNQVAMTDSPVMILGETGTGKEMIARAIHNSSKRRKRLMITINCAALPPSLIESELFGREKGAYTGAISRQIGRFELADNSTIFLDEIGELPLEIQVKLLRVLQFGEFQMLGSPETKRVNVRIIAATNRDLSKAVADGSFRMDLFYRLNVFPVNLPALRQRKEDIPSLTWAFVDEISAKMGKQFEKIAPASMNRLLRYGWPGNVRELRNIVEYNIILSKSSVLEINLPNVELEEDNSDSFNEGQKKHIEMILHQTGWKIRGVNGAAERLEMKESTLRFRMKKLGIESKCRQLN
jgi:PAS domain S-box-containing protein